MRRLRPEVALSTVALIVSVLTLVSGTIWARGAAREDELRAERRTAYAEYIGVVIRCSPWFAATSDSDLSVESDDRLARVDAEIGACQSDLGRTSSTVGMLSGDPEMNESMTILEADLLGSWAVRRDMAQAEDDATLNGPPPQRASTSCATGDAANVVDEYIACQFAVDAKRAQFFLLAQQDVQSDPPDVVDVVIDAAPWVIATLGLGVVVVLVVRRRDRAPRSTPDEST